MKNIFLSILLLSVVSCKESRTENPEQNNAVANAESSITDQLKSGTRFDNNMVDKIYFELRKNDEQLQNLDRKIEKSLEEAQKIINEKEKVLSKSNDYYRDADSRLRIIKDSTLKKTVENELKISESKYDLKTKPVRDKIIELQKSIDATMDYYASFKIRKTLPEIEKYQNQNPLAPKNLELLVKKQNLLTAELKTMK